MSAACHDSMMDITATPIPFPLFSRSSVLRPDNPTRLLNHTHTAGTGVTHFSQVIIVHLLIQSPTSVTTEYSKQKKAKNPLDLLEEQRQVSGGLTNAK